MQVFKKDWFYDLFSHRAVSAAPRDGASSVVNQFGHAALAFAMPSLLALTGCGDGSWNYVNPNYKKPPGLCIEASEGPAPFTYRSFVANVSGTVFNGLQAAQSEQNYNPTYGTTYYGQPYVSGYFTTPVYASIIFSGTIGGTFVAGTADEDGATITSFKNPYRFPVNPAMVDGIAYEDIWQSVDVAATRGMFDYSCQVQKAPAP